jgi:hypothetical protein
MVYEHCAIEFLKQLSFMKHTNIVPLEAIQN